MVNDLIGLKTTSVLFVKTFDLVFTNSFYRLRPLFSDHMYKTRRTFIDAMCTVFSVSLLRKIGQKYSLASWMLYHVAPLLLSSGLHQEMTPDYKASSI